MEKNKSHEPISRSQPRVPSNWTPDGLSQGAATGPVRKTPDACNERTGRGEKK